ncbi:MAG: hypothetical protein ACUVSY_01545 [Roseiflexus sp.]
MSNTIQRGAVAGLITGILALAGVLALALHCLPLRISAVMPMPWYCADPMYGAIEYLAFPVNLLTNDLARAIRLAPLSLVMYVLIGAFVGGILEVSHSSSSARSR